MDPTAARTASGASKNRASGTGSMFGHRLGSRDRLQSSSVDQDAPPRADPIRGLVEPDELFGLDLATVGHFDSDRPLGEIDNEVHLVGVVEAQVRGQESVRVHQRSEMAEYDPLENLGPHRRLVDGIGLAANAVTSP